MKEICIVPSYKREELLWLCLEAIRKESNTMDVWVFSDRGYGSPDLWETCKNFDAKCVIGELHQSYGNSRNVMDAMKWALGTGAEILHLVEEDTVLHGGYFKWAAASLKDSLFRNDVAAVCGRISEVPNWYESPCASWNAPHLKVSLSKVPADYLEAKTREEMQRIADRVFPTSPYKRGGAEQDGFLLRCIEHFGWRTIFPQTPLCSHLGWYGYNQPSSRTGPAGNLAERVECCRAVMYDKALREVLFGQRVAQKEWSGMFGNNREAVMRAANEEQG